jgi:hypothetical protein
MEMSQGTSLFNYLKQAKMSFLFSIFSKSDNRKEKQVLLGSGWGEVEKSRSREDVGKGCKRVNMVQNCVHMKINGKKDMC